MDIRKFACPGSPNFDPPELFSGWEGLCSALLLMAGVALAPTFGFCTVESTLTAIQSRLVDQILPLAAVLGLVLAGFSFVAGSQNARTHVVLAIIGAAIGFGAQSIITLVREVVH